MKLEMKTFMMMIIITLTGCANQMFFYPDNRLYDSPSKHGLSHEDVTFKSKDGTKLTGWFIPAIGPPKGTIIHFHGNAQNMSAHLSFVSWLPQEGFNLFVFDYRGYGASGGKTARKGIHQDCIAALDYISARKDINQNKLLIFGQSLGGANAIALIGDGRASKVQAVAIDSSFYSYRLIVRDRIYHMPIISIARWPLSFLVVRNSYSPSKVINNIAPTPLLIFHGTDDAVIPFHHGEKLSEKAGNPTTFITVTDGQHTDALTRHGTKYRKQLLDFFENALQND